MKIVQCGPHHAETIRAIFNEAILNSTALYDYQSRSPAVIAAWFETKKKGAYPVIGLEDEAGELLGFASYGSFRAWPAYKYSVEHSVYVAAPHRGRGLGKTLLRALIDAAIAQNYHMMIGVIDASNAASIALHRGLDFAHCASIKHAGFKFGRWLDLECYQRILPTPPHPVDG
jgi:phosphinothricin acetyltransferase